MLAPTHDDEVFSMTALAGYAGAVKSGSNALLDIDKWDLSIDSDIYDVSSFSNAWRNQIAGLRKWSGTFSGRQNQSDTTGQVTIQSAVMNGTSLTLGLFTDATHNYSGTAFIKQQQVKAAVNSTVDASFSFEG